MIPGNLGELERLARRGVIGFKAFMSASGVGDCPACDGLTPVQAMATTEEDTVALGATALCAPPLRAEAETDTLWRALAGGRSRSSPPTARPRPRRSDGPRVRRGVSCTPYPEPK
ncbi:MAG: hypothetical protein ABSH51_20545 [Solirubrobacteraceae bacterium]